MTEREPLILSVPWFPHLYDAVIHGAYSVAFSEDWNRMVLDTGEALQNGVPTPVLCLLGPEGSRLLGRERKDRDPHVLFPEHTEAWVSPGCDVGRYLGPKRSADPPLMGSGWGQRRHWDCPGVGRHGPSWGAGTHVAQPNLT